MDESNNRRALRTEPYNGEVMLTQFHVVGRTEVDVKCFSTRTHVYEQSYERV